ncbi:MAG: hypothetical protein WC710_11505 [Gallionella sp.]|jgi:hypothetical protein
MSIFFRVSAIVKAILKPDSIPHDRFGEWPASTDQFLHDYYASNVDLTKLVKCKPCVLMEDSACLYMLDQQCMLDGLQHLKKNHNPT